MMKLKFFIFLSSFLPLFSNANVDFSNVFVGINGGYHWYTKPCVSGYNECNSGSSTFGFNFGYKFYNGFAIDNNIQHYGKVNSRYSDYYTKVNTFSNDISISYTGLIVNDFYYLLKAGISYLDFERNINGVSKSYHSWEPSFGAGIKYKLNNNTDFKITYHFIDDNKNMSGSNLNRITAGFEYKFGDISKGYNKSEENHQKEYITEPNIKNTDVDKVCSEFTYKKNKIILDNFIFDSVELDTPNSRFEPLKKSVGNVIINGYTDLKGGIDYNKNLSLKRALAVKKKILNLGYVDEINLEVIGNGEYYPEIRNEDINRRRVEIEFNTKENSVFCN